MKTKKVAKISSNCVACGTCLKLCPLNALKIHKGIIACVDDSKCVGCAKCAKGCPGNLIDIVRRENSSEQA